jgi:septal ring factor EnvC (AmiA/AmiB activator)
MILHYSIHQLLVKVFWQLLEQLDVRQNSRIEKSWTITPKKKTLKKYQEERTDKLDRLEQLLEEEIKARRALEKKVNELIGLLAEQKKIEEKLEARIAALEKQQQPDDS